MRTDLRFFGKIIFRNISAENMHYPAANDADLIEFLKQVDGIELTKKTYQSDYDAGLGRKVRNRIWTVVVESKVSNAV